MSDISRPDEQEADMSLPFNGRRFASHHHDRRELEVRPGGDQHQAVGRSIVGS